MRKHTLGIGIPAAALVAVLLAYGCGSEDDPVNQPDPCSIEIFGLSSNDEFTVPEQPDDPESHRIDVRWHAAGGGEVMLELLKGGTLLGVMEDAVPNDGSQHWYIDDLVDATGSDYSVRITSLSDGSCTDTSPEFTIRDLEGCEVAVTIFYPGWLDRPPLPAQAGETMNITWSGAHTTGSYDVELWRTSIQITEEFIGKIFEDEVGPALNWEMDSLNRGDGQYWIVVRDAELGSCAGASQVFTMDDGDVCEIEYIAPQGTLSYDEGDPVEIFWRATGSSNLVNIELWYGELNRVDDIALGVDANDGGDGEYTWTVTNFDRAVPTTGNYKFRIVDADDEFCFVYSGIFEIVPSR